MAQVYEVILPTGEKVKPQEWSSTPLWSTVEIAAGAVQDLDGFSFGIGGEVPGSVGPRKATIIDTNLKGGGAIIPQNQELLLYTIQLELFQIISNEVNYRAANTDIGVPDPPEVSAQNVSRFQRDVLLVLVITGSSRKYYDHPVGFFPAAMGVKQTNGAARNSALGGILNANHGGIESYTNRKIATPHRILPGEIFLTGLRFPDGQITGLEFGNDTNARLRVRMYAGGYRKRPVT